MRRLSFCAAACCLFVLTAPLTSAQIEAEKSPTATAPSAAPGSYLGGSDDCATATPIAGVGLFPFDLTAASTGMEGQNETLCMGTSGTGIWNDLWYEWTASGTGLATVRTCNLTNVDTKIAAYPGGGCPLDGTALACNDDTCVTRSEIQFGVTAGLTYMIQVGTWPNATPGAGQFEILAPVTDPGTSYCDCPLGTCGNAGSTGHGCANGTFTGGARLFAAGNPTVATDSIVLHVERATPSQPGLFFQGTNQVNNGAGLAFGDGLRCAGMNVIRLQATSADVNGDAETSIVVSVRGMVSSGDTRHYQFWYRDPLLSPCGALFNLSNGLTIDWN